MKGKRLFLLISMLIILSQQSCYLRSALRSGRTLPPGTSEFGGNLSGIFSAHDSSPYPELYFAHGLSENMDIQAKLGAMNLYVEGRYQFAGDQQSLWAGSIGTGASVGGYFTFEGPFFSAGLHIPAYFSIHPQSNWAGYFSPSCSIRYFAIPTGGPIETGVFVEPGLLAGLSIGKRLKFRIEGGGHHLILIAGENGGLNRWVSQVSLGLGYRFGGKKN